MRISPLDIQQQSFKKILRGYDPREVESFLELVASEFESIMREHLQLKDDLRRKESELLNIQEREKTIKETLITAQKMTSDIKTNAQKESEVIVGRAEMQAEKIMNVAYQRLAKLTNDINDLKQQRAHIEADVQAVIDRHAKLLQSMTAVREEEQAPEEIVRIMKKSL